MKKLLLVGSSSVHLINFEKLISGYFDKVLWLTDKKVPGTGIDTIELGFSFLKPINLLQTPSKIRRIIKEFQPSVIHIHQANSYAYYTLKAASRCSCPVVLTAWGSDILQLPGRNMLMRKMVAANLRGANILTADSGSLAAEMQRLVPDKKLQISVANFGIDIPPFNYRSKENIIYSNRLHKKLYRIDRIIRGFKRLVGSAKNTEWKLVIAGAGEETENLQLLATDPGLNGRVQFEGWVDNATNTDLYARAKFFVSLPESDGTSVSLLEAMANGCVPILSDIPANKEWVTNGENGIIVGEQEEDLFSRALLLDHVKVAAANRELISSRASKDASRKKFFSIYDELLNLQ